MNEMGKVEESAVPSLTVNPSDEGNVTANLLNSISDLYPENLFQKVQTVLSSGKRGVSTLPATGGCGCVC